MTNDRQQSPFEVDWSAHRQFDNANNLNVVQKLSAAVLMYRKQFAVTMLQLVFSPLRRNAMS